MNACLAYSTAFEGPYIMLSEPREAFSPLAIPHAYTLSHTQIERVYQYTQRNILCIRTIYSYIRDYT